MAFLVCFVITFFLGSIPSAYLAGIKLKGIDIRQHGSRNVGATNAFRVLGRKIGVLVFLVDCLKGFLPVYAVCEILPWGAWDAKATGLGVGVAAILGHVFTPFLGFKGGKGIATGAGVLLAVYPLLFVLDAFIWLVVFMITGIVSLSSLVALASLVALSFIYQLKPIFKVIFLVLALFAIWTHRKNILRLIQGNESPIIKR